MICTPIRFFKKIYLAFSIDCLNFVSVGILKILPLFTISTLSNNDVIHGYLGTSNVANYSNIVVQQQYPFKSALFYFLFVV